MSEEYRKLEPSEKHACFVGSGECFIPAAFATDNGEGKEVFMCPMHRVEMEDMEKRFAKLPPALLAKLEDAVAEQLAKQAGQPPALPKWPPPKL